MTVRMAHEHHEYGELFVWVFPRACTLMIPYLARIHDLCLIPFEPSEPYLLAIPPIPPERTQTPLDREAH